MHPDQTVCLLVVCNVALGGKLSLSTSNLLNVKQGEQFMLEPLRGSRLSGHGLRSLKKDKVTKILNILPQLLQLDTGP